MTELNTQTQNPIPAPQQPVAPQAPQTAPAAPQKSRKFAFLAVIAVVLIAAGTGIYYFMKWSDANEQPPTLEAADSNLTGFIQKDVNLKDLTPKFLAFDENDKKLYATKKAQMDKDKKSLTPLKFTNQNKGAHYLYAEKDTNFEEILRNIDPSGEAFALALYNPADKKWKITPNTYYTGTDVIAFDKLKNQKVKEGQGFVVISLRDSSIYEAKTGETFPTKGYPICDQKDEGWHNFVVKNVSDLEKCEAGFTSLWIQDPTNPATYKKTTVAEIKQAGLKYSMVWGKMKEPSINSSYPGLVNPSSRGMGGGNNSPSTDTQTRPQNENNDTPEETPEETTEETVTQEASIAAPEETPEETTEETVTQEASIAAPEEEIPEETTTSDSVEVEAQVETTEEAPEENTTSAPEEFMPFISPDLALATTNNEGEFTVIWNTSNYMQIGFEPVSKYHVVVTNSRGEQQNAAYTADIADTGQVTITVSGLPVGDSYTVDVYAVSENSELVIILSGEMGSHTGYIVLIAGNFQPAVPFGNPPSPF